MDTPIMDKIEEGITNSATGKFNDPSNENESREALDKANREFDKDLTPQKERIEDTTTTKYEQNPKPELNLKEE